jgi:hypothetical protein
LQKGSLNTYKAAAERRRKYIKNFITSEKESAA